jgi:bifunctional aspartokinase / homoserine dehydrogenase 1
MAYKVVKFGGSNLRDINGIKQIQKAVKNYNQPLIIVVSAFYGITNRLIEVIDQSLKDKTVVDAFINDVFSQKLKVILKTVSNENLILDFKHELDLRLNKLRGFLLGIAYIQDIPPFLYDEILSYGEKLSSLVLTYILKEDNVTCEEAFPENIGLITDGEFKNATVDYKASELNLKLRLSENKTYVIPGFYGVSKSKKITLLGRGGSDYSAAAIASCLNADSLDLWKDVKGFLSADPTIIKDAVNIKSLTYAEASELAYFGSKILHPRTPEPLVNRKIPIRILNINDPDEGINPLTIINGKETFASNVIKSVSYSDDFGILKLLGSGVGIKPGILAKTTTELDNSGINIQSVITSQTAINILLSHDDLFNAKKIIESADIHGVNSLIVCDKISIIAAVGEGLTSKYGIAGRVFSSVARKGINVEIISFGASSVAMYFIVNQDDRNETMIQIHKEFFTNEVCCEYCV